MKQKLVDIDKASLTRHFARVNRISKEVISSELLLQAEVSAIIIAAA